MIDSLIDLHTHFEGSVPWRILAQIFVRNRDKILRCEKARITTLINHNQRQIEERIIEILKEMEDEEANKKLMLLFESELVLREPVQNLADFVSRMPTAFIRFACFEENDWVDLINAVCLEFEIEGFKKLELMFCPGALSIKNSISNSAGDFGRIFSENEIISIFARTMEKKNSQGCFKVSGVISLRRGTPDFSSLPNLAADWIEKSPVLTKIDICGDEEHHPLTDMADVLEEWSAKNIPLAVHTGEGGQKAKQEIEFLMEKSWSNLKQLNHAVKTVLLGEARVNNFLLQKKITLTFCPTSNYYTGSLSLLEIQKVSKILLELEKEGLPLFLGNDDPAIFGDLSGLLNKRMQHLREPFALLKKCLRP